MSINRAKAKGICKDIRLVMQVFLFFLPNKLCKNVDIIQDSVGSVIGLWSAVGRS